MGNAISKRRKETESCDLFYSYRIAHLILTIAEGLVDADDIPLADYVEGFTGGIHWHLCSRFLGGTARGGEEVSEQRCRRPGRQKRAVPPPHCSGNESTER